MDRRREAPRLAYSEESCNIGLSITHERLGNPARRTTTGRWNGPAYARSLASKVDVLEQVVRKLPDREHVDEIEEQLERGDTGASDHLRKACGEAVRPRIAQTAGSGTECVSERVYGQDVRPVRDVRTLPLI